MNSLTLLEKDMRIDPVVVGRDANLQEMLSFFMGKNTPDRQKFIIENLRVEKGRG